MRLRSYTPPEAEHALLRNRIVTHDSYTANLKVRRAGVSAGAAYLAPRSALRSDPALPRGLRKSLCPRTRADDRLVRGSELSRRRARAHAPR